MARSRRPSAPEFVNRRGRPRELTLILGDTWEVNHAQGPALNWALAYTTTLLFARMELHSKRNVQRVPNSQTRGITNPTHPYSDDTMNYYGRSEALLIKS